MEKFKVTHTHLSVPMEQAFITEIMAKNGDEAREKIMIKYPHDVIYDVSRGRYDSEYLSPGAYVIETDFSVVLKCDEWYS